MKNQELKISPYVVVSEKIKIRPQTPQRLRCCCERKLTYDHVKCEFKRPRRINVLHKLKKVFQSLLKYYKKTFVSQFFQFSPKIEIHLIRFKRTFSALKHIF